MWTTLWIWVILAVYAYVVFSAAVTVVLDNRQPAKTVAWVLALLSLPLLGLILFYFFGQNIRKERLISKKNMDSLARQTVYALPPRGSKNLPPHYEPLIRYLNRRNQASPVPDNQLHFYGEGADFFVALLRETGRARHHIHLEMYIFENDAVGRLVRDALLDAVRRGVTVRLIYDDVGCWNVKQRFFDEMAAAGIAVANFMPVRFPRFTSKVNYRNHRKICVIDGQTGFVGGMNIARRYARGRRREAWRDCHARICGGAVHDLQRTFLTDWLFVSRTLINDSVYYPSPALAEKPEEDRALIQVVAATPVDEWSDIMYAFTWAIHNARRYVYLQSPYFMPTEPILEAMKTAALGGVDVRLMLPARPDAKSLRWANRSYYAETLKADIRIYHYEAGFLHAKTLVIDDTLCSIGSTNMDFRSFENNFEVNAFIYNATAARRMKKRFLEDVTQCCEISLSAWEKRPRRQRICESFIRIFSPLL